MCGKDTDCGCEESKTFDLKNVSTGQVTKITQEQADAITASGLKLGDPDSVTAAGETDGLPERWHAVLTVEGLRTTDHRLIAKNALTWRQLPIPLFAQFLNAGHYEGHIVGSITSIVRDEASGQIMGEGTFDLGSEAGREAARLCAAQILRWVSVDMEPLETRTVEVNTAASDDIMDILFAEESSSETDWYEEYLQARVAATTMVGIPAFPQAVIAPEGVELDVPEPMGYAPQATEGLLASGKSATSESPPASWFADPELEGPSGITITEDGRVFGHLALWDTCHISFTDICLTPPPSAKDYAFFKQGQLITEEGTSVPVGHLTYNMGHAGPTKTAVESYAHYDNTANVWADVSAGEDEFGIWVAGSVRPGLDEAALRAVRSAPLSGDWRKIGGNLELVAALSVNTPGFPIVASASRLAGEQMSLIAAAVRPPSEMEILARQVAVLTAAIAPVKGLVLGELRSKVNGPVVAKRVASVSALKEKVNAS